MYNDPINEVCYQILDIMARLVKALSLTMYCIYLIADIAISKCTLAAKIAYWKVLDCLRRPVSFRCKRRAAKETTKYYACAALPEKKTTTRQTSELIETERT